MITFRLKTRQTLCLGSHGLRSAVRKAGLPPLKAQRHSSSGGKPPFLTEHVNGAFTFLACFAPFGDLAVDHDQRNGVATVLSAGVGHPWVKSKDLIFNVAGLEFLAPLAFLRDLAVDRDKRNGVATEGHP